jgi:hypothetical protein
MKGFLLKIVLFFLFLPLVYSLFVVIWGEFIPNDQKPNLRYLLGDLGFVNSRIREAEQTKDVDILFLGSSHAYRGFDTRIFNKYGYKSFNLGSSSQTPVQTKVLLKRYLDQLYPDIIIFDVYPAVFDIDGLESGLELISNDKNDLHSIEMLAEIKHITLLNSLLFSYYRDITNLNDGFSEESKIYKDSYIEGGFVEREMEYFSPKKFNKQKWNWRNYQFEAFEDILQMIRERDIELYLVQAPITEAFRESYSNRTEFNEKMSDYGNYHNFNYIVELDDSLHFFDRHHLNQKGVEKFNSKLIEVLELDTI